MLPLTAVTLGVLLSSSNVSGWLRFVRKPRAAEVKYGFETGVNEHAVRKHVTTRYRSVYRCFVLHQMVPVAVKGREVEAQVVERLTDYHVRNELLAFPDQLSRHWLLSSTFAALASPEDQAFTVTSNNATLTGATVAAERRAATAARKRTIEREAEAARQRTRELFGACHGKPWLQNRWLQNRCQASAASAADQDDSPAADDEWLVRNSRQECSRWELLPGRGEGDPQVHRPSRYASVASTFSVATK